MTTAPNRDLYQELRLALVFNGGVSLAVWMGGVAKELDRFRVACVRESGPSGDAYRELLDAVRTVVMTDVIAGTSAGGINGTMLAYVVAKGKSLECIGANGIRETWQKLGSLDNLLATTGEPTSVLSSDALFSGCASLFGQLRDAPSDVPGPASREVRLTVTGTDAYGYTITADDVPARDHRLQMRFRHVDMPGPLWLGPQLRTAIDSLVGPAAGPAGAWPFPDPDSTRDLDGDEAPAYLARAARTTSSFPIAFAPSELPRNYTTDPIAADQPLTATPEMGQILTTPSGSQPLNRDLPVSEQDSRFAIDGGLWDNSPFSAVLRAIDRTPAGRDVRRVLTYVVGTARPPDTPAPNNPPGLVDALRNNLALPSNLSFANDLERIRADLERQRNRKDAVVRLLRPGAPDLFMLATAVFPVYRDRVEEMGTAALGATLPEELSPADAPPAGWGATRDNWCWGIGPVRSSVEQARRLLRAVLYDFAGQPSLSAEDETAVSDLIATREHLSQLARVLDDLEGLPGNQRDTAEGRAVCGEVMHEFAAALAARHEEIVDRQSAQDAVLAAASLAAGSVEDIIKRALAVQIALQALTPDTREHKVDYQLTAIQPDNRWPLAGPPLPPDTDPPDRPPLAGTKLGHFGGFLRESWRLHDWMWGRLDAVSRMVDLLVDYPQLDRLADGPGAADRFAGDLVGVALSDDREVAAELAAAAFTARQEQAPNPSSVDALRHQMVTWYSADIGNALRRPKEDRTPETEEQDFGLIRADLRRRILVPVVEEELGPLLHAACEDGASLPSPAELRAMPDLGLRVLIPERLAKEPGLYEYGHDAEKALANFFFAMNWKVKGFAMRGANMATGALHAPIDLIHHLRRPRCE